MHTRRHYGLAGLRELHESWISLHPGADLYARYEWHLASATHLLNDAASLAYVQVLDGERTVSIVPVIASIAPIPCLGNLRVLSLGLHDHLPLADFPLADDVPIDDVAAALRGALATWPERWDALRCPRALGTSHLMRLARCLPKQTAHIASSAPCNTLDTQRPYNELHAGLSKNLRASLRKSQQRLVESGDAQIACNGLANKPYGTPGSEPGETCADGIQNAYDEFLALEASGWKGETGTGSAIALNPALRGFYAELLAQRSPEFVSEITALVRKGASIAAQFSICVSGCKQVLKIGYDESASRFSPGQVLMARVLEAASAGGIKCVSLVTDMPWHQTWRPQPVPTYCVTVFRQRWRSALFRACFAARRVAKAALLAAIQRYRRIRG